MRVVWWLCVCACLAHAGEWRFDGAVHFDEKVDDNLELSSPEADATDPPIDFVSELGLAGRAVFEDPSWDTDLALRLRGDLPARNTERGRIYWSPDVYVGWRLAPRHVISLSGQSDCLAEPAGDAAGVCRTYTGTAWRWHFHDDWQLRLGIEDYETTYFAGDKLSYSGSGPFLEVRAQVSDRLATWVRGSFFRYHNVFELDSDEAPQDGRHALGELGIDWIPGGGISLLLTGQYQRDDAKTEVRQVGVRAVLDDALDPVAEFNYEKLRGTALATWRANETFTFGAYGEVVRLEFTDGPERRDLRWLASGWARAALTDSGMSARLRLLTRRNQSTEDAADYTNYIVSIGLEQRW